MEFNNAAKKRTIQTLADEAGAIHLSDSDIEDEQDLIDQRPLIVVDNVENRPDNGADGGCMTSTCDEPAQASNEVMALNPVFASDVAVPAAIAASNEATALNPINCLVNDLPLNVATASTSAGVLAVTAGHSLLSDALAGPLNMFSANVIIIFIPARILLFYSDLFFY